MLSDCLDDDLVDRFVASGADGEEQARVRAHLPGCATCRRLVSELARASIPSSPPVAGEIDRGPLLRGTEVGRFLILELIGAGAMGMVYAAYDPRLDRKIALKLLRSEAAAVEVPLLRSRLLREAQAMARLVHPNVVTIHDVGESGELVYIAMELVRGRSLRSWLDERPRPWREVLEVYLQAGRGLAAAHRAGLVHRDFKPDNVLIADDGRVLVSDFGTAHLAAGSGAAPDSGSGRDRRPYPGAHELDPALPGASLTATGMIMGTPAYMAPEQLAAAPIDARADVYAFGVALWEGLNAMPFTYGRSPSGACGRRRSS
jgi:eukaryotic-like serine/threonine-protein kinase